MWPITELGRFIGLSTKKDCTKRHRWSAIRLPCPSSRNFPGPCSPTVLKSSLLFTHCWHDQRTKRQGILSPPTKFAVVDMAETSEEEEEVKERRGIPAAEFVEDVHTYLNQSGLHVNSAVAFLQERYLSLSLSLSLKKFVFIQSRMKLVMNWWC